MVICDRCYVGYGHCGTPEDLRVITAEGYGLSLGLLQKCSEGGHWPPLSKEQRPDLVERCSYCADFQGELKSSPSDDEKAQIKRQNQIDVRKRIEEIFDPLYADEHRLDDDHMQPYLDYLALTQPGVPRANLRQLPEVMPMSSPALALPGSGFQDTITSDQVFTFPNEGQVGLGIQTGGESSGLPANIFLARQLAHCPAWLEKNELVTKLHTGQIVPILWSTELASPDTRNRYVEGLDFIDNRRLKSPLIHETLDQYKQRQIDVLGRSASQDRAFEGEYEMWVDKVRAMGKMEWVPTEDD